MYITRKEDLKEYDQMQYLESNEGHESFEEWNLHKFYRCERLAKVAGWWFNRISTRHGIKYDLVTIPDNWSDTFCTKVGCECGTGNSIISYESYSIAWMAEILGGVFFKELNKKSDKKIDRRVTRQRLNLIKKTTIKCSNNCSGYITSCEASYSEDGSAFCCDACRDGEMGQI